MKSHAPDRLPLRQFGWVLALGLALAAGLMETGPAALVVEALAALVFAVATIWPVALRGPYRSLASLGAPARRQRLISPSPQSPRAGPPASAG